MRTAIPRGTRSDQPPAENPIDVDRGCEGMTQDNEFMIETETAQLDGTEVLCVLLKGIFTFSHAADVDRVILKQVGPTTQGLIIDLSGVQYIDSYGLGVLVALSRKTIQMKVKPVVVGVSDRIDNFIQKAHLGDLFFTLDAREEALEYLSTLGGR